MWLDTGSTGTYCLEFQRGGGYVYALWATRGEREMILTGGGSFAGEDSTGRPLAIGKDGSLTARDMPCCVVSEKPLAKATCGKASFADPPKTTVVAPMADARAWRIAPEPDDSFAKYCGYKPLVRGDVELGAGSDRSIRLTLEGPSDSPDLAGRYAILEPAQGPVAAQGEPAGVGVWVKGNANWGRVYFEFEDANGRRWRSNGWQRSPAPGDWDMSDWEGETAIDHDGWRFVSVRLPALYPSGYYTPTLRDWRCLTGSAKSDLTACPIRLARLFVVMREKLVYMTDMVPATSRSIELRDLSVWADRQETVE